MTASGLAFHFVFIVFALLAVVSVSFCSLTK